MSRLLEWQLRELDRPIPPEAIETKPGRGNPSYVKGIWVEDEANRIFGPHNWTKEITYREPVIMLTEQRKNRQSGETYDVTIARAVRGVRVPVTFADGTTASREGDACGTGEGLEAYHNAIAEAVTDAAKIALARFGRRLGGELYFGGKYATPRVSTGYVTRAAAGFKDPEKAKKAAAWIESSALRYDQIRAVCGD